MIQNSSIGDKIRKMEQDYKSSPVTISEHVQFSMLEVINTIEAYLNSKFTFGSTDSLGRDKPFFNIVVAAANIWQRATDIDRKHISFRATKASDDIPSFAAKVQTQDWMRRAKFGAFLNDWGRTLSRYGSAIVEFVESDGQLFISVLPWNRLIVDPIDFDNNPLIKILELTEAQLRDNESYNQTMVDGLIDSQTQRKTTRGRTKDNRTGYYRLYEIHGKFSEALYKEAKGEEASEGDSKIFSEQMHVVSFVGIKRGDNEDFVLFSGKKPKKTHKLTHLIREDGRTLSIGAVEHLFEAQWMTNHTIKAIKDQLDITSKVIFQTADDTFLGQNLLTSVEVGDTLIHQPNNPFTQLNNQSTDNPALREYQAMWKNQGNEITGISEAMLGASPTSGTAWRQTEALLSESHNLFELMTENKGLDLEDMFREWIIPYIKTQIDNADEISAVLEAHDITKIDGKYARALAPKLVNEEVKRKMMEGELPSAEEVTALQSATEQGIKSSLSESGNVRFIKPSDIDNTTWKELLKDFEWNIEIDITGESRDTQNAMATLSTALQVVMNPAYAQNEQAKMVVGKILDLTGAVSPIELQQITSAPATPAQPQQSTPGANPTDALKV